MSLPLPHPHASSSAAVDVSPLSARLAYLARIARVYARPASGPLSFWYEDPKLNERAFADRREYFMKFQKKAEYGGPFDPDGIPLLDYQGTIGRQYNPIAIAQYGLARFNRWCASGAADDRAAWVRTADWLAASLRPNRHGVPVWMHDFNWPYRQTLRAPWYSALAQGSGISLLVRAARETGDERYAEAAARAFAALTLPVDAGGVAFRDSDGYFWLEEYIVDPPSHILNGFIWASWGVYDHAEATRDPAAASLWQECVRTLRERLGMFDTGWWSLYEAPHDGRQMLASFYYHRLHITQLRVMERLTGDSFFGNAAERFQQHFDNRLNRTRALVQKAWFKLRHY